MIEQEYEKLLKEKLNEIKDTKSPLILHGTREMAFYSRVALKEIGKNYVCYMDNNAEKQGNTIDGKKILSVEDAYRQYPNALVIVCSFNTANIDEIAAHLEMVGFRQVVSAIALFYFYQLYVMKRPVSSGEFAKTIYMQQHTEQYMVVGKAPGNLPVVITEKCNLRCRDCGVMIPYYEHPKHYEKDFIVKSIYSMAESVDLIETLNIIGGETFLHPDLVDICKAAAEIPNIFSVMIVTNGSVAVKPEIMKALASCVTCISISDYGRCSPRKDELYNEAIKNGIYCEIFTDDSAWSKFYPPKKQHRSKSVNEEIFENCFWSYHAEKIINGEFHLCDFSAAIAPFHVLKDNEQDYLNLMDGNMPAEAKRKKMERLLYQTKTLEACDYCRFYLQEKTERALQVKGTLKLEE